MRKQLAERGATGILGLSRKFKQMDDDGSNSLSIQEFRNAIKEFGLDFTEAEIAELFNTFDRDRSGTIDYTEFLLKIRVGDFSVTLCHTDCLDLFLLHS